MAKLRIFVSSTCYDLGVIRSELRPFIFSHGYEPVMSDYSDILYDHRSHTHESCLKEIPACDMVILVIGSRYGGAGIPSVLERLDFDYVRSQSDKNEIFSEKEKLSITQLEILKAIEQSIPIYAFVEEKVLHDHHVYEKNKNKPSVINEIEFPSIQKKETAKYIFEFINFLTHRKNNNGILPFARLDEIKEHLTGQWSQLFQRLLSEDKNRTIETKRYADFSERLEDLKAVVLASIATPNLRETARGAIKYRALIGFVSSFKTENYTEVLTSDMSWDEMLSRFSVSEIKEVEDGEFSPDVYLILNDGTFYSCRYSLQVISELKIDWESFRQLDKDNRFAIVEATLESRETRRFKPIRYVNKSLDSFLEEKNTEEGDGDFV